MRIACAVVALLVAGSARAGDAYAVDVRASTYALLTRQPLLAGPGGASALPQGVASLYGYAFLRVTGVDTPLGRDGLTGELSAWGALGALGPAGQVSDGDLQAAWLQHASARWRLKLGRQVTLPGAARYVRFDGVSGAVRLGPMEVEAYAGLATLPRFMRPRGYFALGSVADALKDPMLLEVQARPGQWLAGARASWVGSPRLRAALAFHEQHGAEGLAFRNVAERAQRGEHLGRGRRSRGARLVGAEASRGPPLRGPHGARETAHVPRLRLRRAGAPAARLLGARGLRRSGVA